MNEEWNSVFSLYVKHLTRPDGRDTFESTPELAKTILDLLPSGKWSKALDIGSGCGNLAIPLAEKAGKVTGIEPDKKNILETQNRIQKAGIKNIFVIKGSFERMHYEESADLIVSSLALHQVKYRKKELAIKNIREHLAPEGTFILCDTMMFFDPEEDSKLFNRIYRYLLPKMTSPKIYEKYIRSKIAEESYIYTWADMKKLTPGKSRFYSVYDLRTWLEKEALTIDRIEQISPFFGIAVIRNS